MREGEGLEKDLEPAKTPGASRLRRLSVHGKFGGRCAYCGQEITLKGMQIDHIQPRFKFGADSLDNLNPACASCNNWKHSFTLDEFRAELEAQTERLRRYSSQFRIAERFGLVAQAAIKVLFYFERTMARSAPNPSSGEGTSDVTPSTVQGVEAQAPGGRA